MEPVQLAELGERICILGPSNSGKSTLAEAIGKKQELAVIHLDTLFHLPHTDWKPRPHHEFVALHDRAITGSRWVMEGNYSTCLPQRLQRATGVIVLDISTVASLFRYLRRTLLRRSRIGSLEGGQDSIKLDMLRHIVLATPANRRRYAELFQTTELPKAYLPGVRTIDAAYRSWSLERSPATGIAR